MQGSLPPIRFAELAAALLDRVEHLVPRWLPGGKRDGHEWKCGNLQGGEGSSAGVNMHTGKWADFATGEQGGDLLSLYAAIHGLPMSKAAAQVAREQGLTDVAGIVTGGPESGRAGAPRTAPVPPQRQPAAAPPAASRESEGWRSVIPVPANAPAPTFKHHARAAEDIVHTAEYRIGDELHGFVVRFRTSDGGKETLPYTWCVSARDGGARWHWKTWDEPRPLYLPGHALPAGRTVILVEGEKKAGVLQALLDAGSPGVYCVASWPGGCKAWRKADWSPLAGTTVLAWPDCDAKREPLTQAERKATPDKAAQLVLQQGKPLLPESDQPGSAAMLGIGAHLRDQHGCTVQMLPIPAPGTVADGWDCADAIEHDGWDLARVLALFGQASALPDSMPPAPEKIDGLAGAGSGGDAPPPAGSAGAADDKRPWWLRPYWDAEKCRWLVSRKLVIAALTHDEALAGVLGRNELSSNIEARRAWPWSARAQAVTGADDLLLGQYLSATYGLPSIARAALSEAIETVAHQHPYHPVRDWLQGLEWDGKPRVAKWLAHALRETPETLTAPMFEYLSLVGRCWVLGMVNRVMDPGCKFDYCPVLEGQGGLGKSTLVETIAGAEWYSDTHFDVSRGKEGQEQVQGLWVYEIAELAGFGRAEIQLIKAFISAKVDRYRPSYGRVVESYPRQCVQVGTTNERTYLRDRTGNRRFWPIPVRQRINIAWVRAAREQIMAEAFSMYRCNERYIPTPEEELRLFLPMQESRLIETAVLSELLNVLTREPIGGGIGSVVNNLTEFVTISQLTQALGVDAAKSSAALEGQIRAWMEHEGWERTKRQVNGVRAWGYVRPRGWPAPDLDEIETSPRAADQAAPTSQESDEVPF